MIRESKPARLSQPRRGTVLNPDALDVLIPTSDSSICGITVRPQSTGPSIAIALFHNRRLMDQWATVSAVTGRDRTK